MVTSQNQNQGMKTWESDTEFCVCFSRFHGEMVTCLCSIILIPTPDQTGSRKRSSHPHHTHSSPISHPHRWHPPPPSERGWGPSGWSTSTRTLSRETKQDGNTSQRCNAGRRNSIPNNILRFTRVTWSILTFTGDAVWRGREPKMYRFIRCVWRKSSEFTSQTPPTQGSTTSKTHTLGVILSRVCVYILLP